MAAHAHVGLTRVAAIAITRVPGLNLAVRAAAVVRQMVAVIAPFCAHAQPVAAHRRAAVSGGKGAAHALKADLDRAVGVAAVARDGVVVIAALRRPEDTPAVFNVPS